MEKTHKVVMYAKKYTGFPIKPIEVWCSSWEEAQAELKRLSKELERDYFNIHGHIEGERPVQPVSIPTEPTHYKVTCKDFMGCHESFLIPIDMDLEKALDLIDDNLKVVEIEKVIRNIAARPYHSRLHMKGGGEKVKNPNN